MRILLENSKGFSFETLGFLSSQIEDMHWAINRPTGMILVTGPTGSGQDDDSLHRFGYFEHSRC